ncbi:hypothetical protein [Streptomyces sp. MMG1533]|nr:hypothetical protein [Streptomyces sp. MMG1533]
MPTGRERPRAAADAESGAALSEAVEKELDAVENQPRTAEN